MCMCAHTQTGSSLKSSIAVQHHFTLLKILLIWKASYFYKREFIFEETPDMENHFENYQLHVNSVRVLYVCCVCLCMCVCAFIIIAW